MSDHASQFAQTTLGRTLRTAPGSASSEAKEYVVKWFGSSGNSRQFSYPIISRTEVTEVDLVDIPEVPGKKQGRIVFELDVQDDMCNPGYTLHGGCSSTLIDVFTTLCVSLTAFYVAPKLPTHVSLVLNTTYHSPAHIGTRLKIVCTTVAFGARVMTAKAEIYDKTNGRLVATGVHVKMQPSIPPPPKL